MSDSIEGVKPGVRLKGRGYKAKFTRILPSLTIRQMVLLPMVADVWFYHKKHKPRF